MQKGVQRVLSGEADSNRFEASLFDDWASRLLPMFETDQEQGWRAVLCSYYGIPEGIA